MHGKMRRTMKKKRCLVLIVLLVCIFVGYSIKNRAEKTKIDLNSDTPLKFDGTEQIGGVIHEIKNSV